MLSEIAAQHVRNVRGRGELEGANRVGTGGEQGEGPFVRIYLRVGTDGAGIERIVAASYETHGCPASIAAGSMFVALVTGRTSEEALRIEAEDLRTVLGGLPEGKEQMADLAVTALRRAIGSER